jgi:hypothetical protein
MLPTLRFVHSMRKREYLESALAQGLMLTDHEVMFEPATSGAKLQTLLADVVPILEGRLHAIGAPWETLSAGRQKVILMGLGSMRGMIPMVCFTEVPEGRDLALHHLSFGGYGVVVRKDWLDRNGGDRVLYLGEDSPVTRNLYRVIATLNASSLFRSHSGDVLFGNHCFPPVLDLLAYMERRDNLSEFEWRIAGHHGFHSGKRTTGQRLHLPLTDVEAVLVQNQDEVVEFERLLNSMASRTVGELPKVLYQPTILK